MGMFDDIQSDALRCPLCGGNMSWQSKDGDCLMETLTVHELMDKATSPTIYTSCNDCHIWIEVNIKRQLAKTPAQWDQYRKELALMKAKRGLLTDEE